eukprot:1136984-Pelagomonas_calceolata.AAC.4
MAGALTSLPVKSFPSSSRTTRVASGPMPAANTAQPTVMEMERVRHPCENCGAVSGKDTAPMDLRK